MNTHTIATLIIMGSIPILLIGYWSLKRILRHARRNKIGARPFPPEWETILQDNFPFYPHLNKDQSSRLHALIQVFLDEKVFEGCKGQEITDEVRVTVAGQACLLLINLAEPHWYPRLHTILVYPAAYIARDQRGEYKDSARLGESWNEGTVVLAWDHVKGGVQNFDDGENVTLHEFAHQLDQEDGSGDGYPILDNLAAYSAWSKVLGKEFEKLQRKASRGKRTLIDHYGATNEAEFFAVATTHFFEQPRHFKKKHAELYDALKSYYKLDPLSWED